MVGSAPAVKILLVDDNPANLLALEATLAPLRQCLVRAASGKEALARLREDHFAVVLLDVHMPELDGYATCRLMRADERTRALPVIFLTAVYNDREHEASGYAVGAVDYITKPFDPAVLKAKVGALVAMHVQALELERKSAALREAERAALEEAAARRIAEEANRAKDQFLAVISHELRTPLSTMLGWVEMLRTGRIDGERATKALETIVRCGHEQNRLIEDLLDSSRIAAGTMQLRKGETDLSAIVDSVVQEQQLLANPRRILLRVARGERCVLHADPHRVRQIAWNLLANAIKFSREGGAIDVRLLRNADSVTLEIADDGVGIAAAFLPRIFEHFRQEDYGNTRVHGGLGLGLAIVRHLVELHGGTVTAASPGPGLGSTFTVELPLDGVTAGAHYKELTATGRFRAIRSGKPTDLTNVRVLFVDDEEDTRELVGQILSDAGARVTVAASAAEAMQTLQTLPVDVIVSDLSMPHEDGFSLVRRVAEWSASRGVTVPAIALSAFAAVEDRERALEAGFETHLAKPFEPARLLSVISAIAVKR